MSTNDQVRRRRRTPRTWLVMRKFKRWTRPWSMVGSEADRGIDYLTRTLGSWHPDTVLARERLAYWLSKEGNRAAALRLTEAEVAGRMAEFGTEHPDTLLARRALIGRHHEAGDLTAAIAESRVLGQDLSRVLGPDHGDTHSVRRFLAHFLMASGETNEAVRLLTDQLTEVEALGRTPNRHKEMRNTRDALARALEHNGDIREALALVEEELAAERITIYGIDENLGEYPLKRLQAWRDRLAAQVRKQGR